MNLLSNKSRKVPFQPFLQLIINEWSFVSKTKKRLLIEVFKTATFTQVDTQSDFLVPYHHISIELDNLLNSKANYQYLKLHMILLIGKIGEKITKTRILVRVH